MEETGRGETRGKEGARDRREVRRGPAGAGVGVSERDDVGVSGGGVPRVRAVRCGGVRWGLGSVDDKGDGPYGRRTERDSRQSGGVRRRHTGGLSWSGYRLYNPRTNTGVWVYTRDRVLAGTE